MSGPEGDIFVMRSLEEARNCGADSDGPSYIEIMGRYTDDPQTTPATVVPKSGGRRRARHPPPRTNFG